MVPENTSELRPVAILEQLERILSDSEFSQSERMSRFLRFVVENSVNQRSGELKEYLIGVEVFDRKSSYDPRLDPIVRVEARRLRSKLSRYYEGAGRDGELLIELPKGSYAAVFKKRAPDVRDQPAPVPNNTITVLPFANLTPNEENEYFSDGLTQELIHGLTRVEGLRVMAWNSAEKLKSAAGDIDAVRRQLQVGSVLAGSVRRAGNRVRIAVQLIDTSSGYYLWSEVYDRELKDLFQIQDEIACAIVTTLRIKLADRLGLRAQHCPTNNPEAHNLYLKGRFHQAKRTVEGFWLSLRFFEQAVALDPNFALGWAGLADAFSLLAEYGLEPATEAMPKAKQAAHKALALDESLGEAWTSLAIIRSLFDWEWDDAEVCYRRAIELNPGYAQLHHWFGIDYFATLGRFEEARAELQLARDLDPWSTIIIEGQGLTEVLDRRYDVAIRRLKEALELDPHFYKGYTSIGRALIQKGDYAGAIEMLNKGRSLAANIPTILSALGQAHALAGRPAETRRLLGELDEMAKTRNVPFTCFAIIHIGLGDKERALEMLERSCDRREIPLSSLKVHPVYDPLRAEPRFTALLRRLRFIAA